MKKIIFAIVAMLVLVGTVNAQTKKRTIDPENLPKVANELIQKHWPSCAIDNAYIKGKEYEALLTDGTIIQFDSKGVWKEMKCTDGLPVTLVPVYITRYIVDRYPKQLIIDCEKLKGGYEVMITNGLKIQFDLRGNVTHVDE
ncbi:MAG: PepSY-like domain-containing protein [Bacteroidales bacterium]|nr:PepSY-like domain-containing protein [Candidatus Colimorpha merdihippi]MCQ2281034.1 PepSY-like domain-containing protein [Bacteroidales bacterium]